MIWLLGRTYCTGTLQDLAAVHAIQDQYTLVPLAMFGKPRPAPAKGVIDPNIDMKAPPRDQIDKMDAATFFKRLAVLMKDNPATPEDAPMVATLACLGIVGNLDFTKLPALVAQGLSRARKQAARKSSGRPLAWPDCLS